MKIIEVDEELYQYIAARTRSIGESASDILRRLLQLPSVGGINTVTDNTPKPAKSAVENQGVFSDEADEIVTEEIPQSDNTIRFVVEPLEADTRKTMETTVRQAVDNVRHLLQSEDFQQENRAVIRFLNILTVLYQTDPSGFAQATERETSQGRTRTYFARDEETLLAAGNHTKPKRIPDTPYWVITNTNSARKMLMLERVGEFMHLPQALMDEIRIYFIANS